MKNPSNAYQKMPVLTENTGILRVCGKHLRTLNLKTSVESDQSRQPLGAPSKTEKRLFTNQVTSNFSVSLCTPMVYRSFSRSTEVFRLKAQQSGFTLIEVMAVVVILSILSSVALLNMNFDNKGKQVRQQAQQLAALIELASDEAIYLQKELGLRFGEGEFVFYQLEKKKAKAIDTEESADSKQPKPPYWLPVNNDQRLRSRSISEDMEVELSISGVEVLIENPTETDTKELKVKPQIMMLSNGEVLPDFSILIRDVDGEHEYTVATGVNVPVIVERVE